MKVLLAIDGSPHSHAALMELATRLWPHGTQVQILTVIHPTMPLFLEPTLVLAAAYMEQTLELRSHGYGRFRRTVLGSVAGAAVAKAPCSVQVVRAKHLLHETESAA